MNPTPWQSFREKAAKAPRKIILADGEDPRVIKAAAVAKTQGIAEPLLIGSPSRILPLWKQFAPESDLRTAEFDSLPTAEKESLLHDLQSLPKNKELSHEQLTTLAQDSLWLGCLLLKKGKADGFIGGAARTTADTLRAVFPTIGLAPKASTLFGFFLIEPHHPSPAQNTLVLLADCAVIPEPSPKQLAHIALGASAAYEFFTGQAARTAFLSFSTNGSAAHPLVDKVRQARDWAREKAPDKIFEGEWQADAALDSFTAKIKGVGHVASAGKANVLIVPDLNCGNIAYKLVQRVGGCRAVGPVLWGTSQPANDLSRGCSTEDVVDMLALTVLQAQAAREAVPVQEGDRRHAR